MRQPDLHAFLGPRMGEIRLKHGDNRMVSLGLDALHLATRVGPDHHVAELDVADVAPIGHIDGRGAVALVADKFGAGRALHRAPCRPGIPTGSGRPSVPACRCGQSPASRLRRVGESWSIYGFAFHRFFVSGCQLVIGRPPLITGVSFCSARVYDVVTVGSLNRLHRRQGSLQSDTRRRGARPRCRRSCSY